MKTLFLLPFICLGIHVSAHASTPECVFVKNSNLTAVNPAIVLSDQDIHLTKTGCQLKRSFEVRTQKNERRFLIISKNLSSKKSGCSKVDPSLIRIQLSTDEKGVDAILDFTGKSIHLQTEELTLDAAPAQCASTDMVI